MASFEPVRAIIRGLDVLRAVSEHGPLTASQAARRVDLPQPTTVRILETLLEAGYIFRLPEEMSFGVTARALALGRGYDARSRLVQIARPEIEALRTRIGWPSNLAVREGRTMVIAYTNRDANGMSMPGRLGALIPLLATGVGRVLLASLDGAEREKLIQQLKESQNRWDQLPDLWESLDEKLTEVARQGYGFAEESYLDEIYGSRIWAVAVPITVNGHVVAAISSLVLRTAGPREQQLAYVLPALRESASRIGAVLEHEASSGEEPM